MSTKKLSFLDALIIKITVAKWASEGKPSSCLYSETDSIEDYLVTAFDKINAESASSPQESAGEAKS
jgi:hypothetical protein